MKYTTFSIIDTQHNDIQQNDTLNIDGQHNNTDPNGSNWYTQHNESEHSDIQYNEIKCNDSQITTVS